MAVVIFVLLNKLKLCAEKDARHIIRETTSHFVVVMRAGRETRILWCGLAIHEHFHAYGNRSGEPIISPYARIFNTLVERTYIVEPI